MVMVEGVGFDWSLKPIVWLLRLIGIDLRQYSGSGKWSLSYLVSCLLFNFSIHIYNCWEMAVVIANSIPSPTNWTLSFWSTRPTSSFCRNPLCPRVCRPLTIVGTVKSIPGVWTISRRMLLQSEEDFIIWYLHISIWKILVWQVFYSYLLMRLVLIILTFLFIGISALYWHSHYTLHWAVGLQAFQSSSLTFWQFWQNFFDWADRSCLWFVV